jgi:hypothetical protein
MASSASERHPGFTQIRLGSSQRARSVLEVPAGRQVRDERPRFVQTIKGISHEEGEAVEDD